MVAFRFHTPTAGKLAEEEAVICTHYFEVQQPRWVKLAEERIRIKEAKEIFTSKSSKPCAYLHMTVLLNPLPMCSIECTTKELKKHWPKWDEATIDSYRLQFRVIDLNEDGLIDFNELYVALKVISIL